MAMQFSVIERPILPKDYTAITWNCYQLYQLTKDTPQQEQVEKLEKYKYAEN